mgnify:FL=1
MRSWVKRAEDDGAVIVGGEGLIANEAPSDDDLEKCRELGRALIK